MLPILSHRLTNNTCLAVTLEEAARQCRLSVDDLKDADVSNALTAAIYAAQGYIESNYSIIFGLNDIKSIYALDNTTIIHFPFSMVADVKAVAIENANPTYTFYKGDTHSFIELSTATTGKLEVVYSAGLVEIPNNVKQAVLMLVSYYFDNRSPDDKTTVSTFAVDALLLPYKKLY